MSIWKKIIIGLIILELAFEIYAGHLIGVLFLITPVLMFKFYQKLYTEMGSLEGNQIDLDSDKINDVIERGKTLKKGKISPYIKLTLLIVTIIIYSVLLILYLDTKFDLLL